MSGRPFDHAALIAEIEAEAERRRQSGDIPPGLERELDELFDALAPPARQSLDAALDDAEQAAVVDADVPLDSTRPAYVPVKRAVRRLVLFSLDHLARQVSAFAEASTRAMRILAARVEERERALSEQTERLGRLVAGADAGLARFRSHLPDRLAPWRDDVVALLAGVEGRVLHGEAGDGSLVAALEAAGVDAYGVEDLPDHLERLADDRLGGLVVSGCVDHLPAAAQAGLAARAGRVLAPGGRLVVVGGTVEAWAARTSPLEFDLAPGRPLHTVTWEALLAAQGFPDVEVRTAPGTFLVTAARPR